MTTRLSRLCRGRPSIPDERQWYANLLWLDRRKCLLLTHAETFFSVFVPDIRKANKLARFIEYDVIDQSQAGVVDVDA